MYDKKDEEEDWDYLRRKASEIFNALSRIEGFEEAKNELFDNGDFYWGGNDKVDLTNKAMMGLLQLEIEKLQTKIMNMEDKYRIVKEKEAEWHLFGREKNKVVFENGVGELAKIPLNLFDIIANVKAFDGEIQSDGADVKYISKGTLICTLPKALVNQILIKKGTMGE